MSERKLVSIICPVFNEEESIPVFYGRLHAALQPLRDRYDFELIFTNNCSTDRSLEAIRQLRRDYPWVQVITLSRNFGYQASVMAGLYHAAGDASIVIDVDCEDPPEMIPRLIEFWEQGFDVVYGERVQRSELFLIHLMRRLFYRLNRMVADSEIILDMAEFALISRRVRELMLDNRSTYPFLRTEIAYVGFPRKPIPYRRQPRVRGKTHYSLLGMTNYAIGGILSSSTYPLRLAAYLGIPLAAAHLLIAIFWRVAIDRIFPLLLLADLFYLVFFVSFLSIYLARLYKDHVDRPVFIVDWTASALNRIDGAGCENRSGVWTTNRRRDDIASVLGRQ